MIRRLERERLSSDLAAVDRLVDSASPDDVIGRISLTSRRDQIAAELGALDSGDPGPQARAALFFGGDPVKGNLGVDAEFAGKALSGYEDLVTKVWASSQHGILRRSGPVPGKQAARLHITGVVQGSFGFELTELGDSPGEDTFPLRQAVEQTTRAIAAAAESDDALADVVDSLDHRAFIALRDFFSHLKRGHASLRIVSEDQGKDLSLEAVSAAADRTFSSEMVEDTVSRNGTFSAVLPEGRRFEFRDEDNKLLTGRVSDELSLADLREMNRTFGNRACAAEFHVVTLSSSGRTRKRYVLLKLNDSGAA